MSRVLAIGFIGSQLLLIAGVHPSNPAFIALMLLFVFGLGRLAWQGQLSRLQWLLSPPVFALIFLAVALGWIALIVTEYYSIEYSNFDTGIYANGVAIFTETGRYFSSILGMPALGEHFTPILLLFSPLLKLTPSFLWFPVVKWLAFLACPFLLYRLGQVVLGARSPLLWFAPILFCIHRYVGKTVAMEFQPSGLALPIILLVFLSAAEGKRLRMFLGLALLLFFKEHLALIWVSLGCYLHLFRRERAMSLVVAALGVLAGLGIYGTLMPFFAEGFPNSHAERFAPFSLLGQKAKLLAFALLSVGFLPLLSPRFLPVLIAAFGIALVSGDPLMVTFNYHYQDIALAVLFVGVVHGLAFIQVSSPRILQSQRLRAGTCLAAAALFISQVNYPTRRVLREWPTERELAIVRSLEELSRSLPQERTIWALNSLGPYLFAHPKLRPIIHLEAPLNDPSNPMIVLADQVESWPLTEEEYRELKRRAESAIILGEHQQ